MLILFGSMSFLWLIISAIQEWEWIPIRAYQLGRIVRLIHQDDLSPLLYFGEFSPKLILTTGVVLSALSVLLAKSWRKLVWVLLIVAHAAPLYSWCSQSVETRVAVNQEFLKPFKNRKHIEEPQYRSAKHALANGGHFGTGWQQGEMTQYQLLPYAYSDLIFAAYAEEWGFVGAIFLLLLYCALTGNLFYMSYKVDDRFSSLCIAAMAFMVMGQVFIHVGYTTGLLPMTGIALPFMSTGGSALITSWVGMSLVHSCTKEKDDLFA